MIILEMINISHDRVLLPYVIFEEDELNNLTEQMEESISHGMYLNTHLVTGKGLKALNTYKIISRYDYGNTRVKLESL